MDRTVRIRETEKELSLLFMGDFCPIGKVEEACRGGDIERIFDSFKAELKEKDLSVANLESPLTSAETGIIKEGPHIKADPVAVKIVKACDIDVVSLGNNHIMDYTEEGLLDTIKVLDENGIEHLGAGLDVNKARQSLIREVKGVRIAFLSFCETEFNMASETKAGCAPIVMHEVSGAILQAKENADLVIVLLHCGSEHYPLPSPRIKKQCRFFADCGAAAVICHHTHTVEGYEVYKDTPIFYGLGNFIFGYRMKRQKIKSLGHEGLMARLDFNRNGTIQLGIIPYFFDAKESALVKMDKNQTDAFWRRLELLNDIIQDDEKLGRLWRQYSLRRYRAWYSPTIKKARLYFWKNKAMRSTVLWHYRTTESHNDIIVTALNELRHGKIDQDMEMKALLDDLIGCETKVMKIKRMIRAWR